jgi:hypothetical protein
MDSWFRVWGLEFEYKSSGTWFGIWGKGVKV